MLKFSSHPSVVVPGSEVAEEKCCCPCLIWGWLRKGGITKGGRKRRRRRVRSGGTEELREVYRRSLSFWRQPEKRWRKEMKKEWEEHRTGKIKILDLDIVPIWCFLKHGDTDRDWNNFSFYNDGRWCSEMMVEHVEDEREIYHYGASSVRTNTTLLFLVSESSNKAGWITPVLELAVIQCRRKDSNGSQTLRKKVKLPMYTRITGRLHPKCTDMKLECKRETDSRRWNE